jgi:hypothetical protein
MDAPRLKLSIVVAPSRSAARMNVGNPPARGRSTSTRVPVGSFSFSFLYSTSLLPVVVVLVLYDTVSCQLASQLIGL